jgi:hypothetical protein
MSNLPAGCLLATILLAISAIPAWLTHVIVTIQNEQWVFLLAGALFAPIGVIHGWGIWFGLF